jgi:BASS family bile acid:Na+ symporter
MASLLQGLLGIVVPLFAISSMAGIGLRYDFLHVVKPLRRPSMVLTALLANFAAVPPWALLLARLFRLEEMHAVGLFLVATGAGAPFLLKLTMVARGDPALAGGLLLLLLPATILFMPLVVPLALPGAELDLRAVTTTLVATMLLPLAVGFVVRRRWQTRAKRIVPFLGKLSTVLLVALIGATFLANLDGVASLLATAAVPAAALLVLGAVVFGYLLGVPSAESRTVLALGTGQRNIAAATIVATSGFPSDGPLGMVVVTSLVAFAILFPAARLLRERRARRAETRRVRFGPPMAGDPVGSRR